MIPGEILCIAELPLGVLPSARNFGVADPFRTLDPHDTDLTYLAELLPFDPELEGGWRGPPAPVGALLPVGCFDYSYRGSERITYLGDYHNYQSLPGDDPANTPFPGRLDPAYSLAARMGSSADPMGGAQVDVGNISIQNADGRFDDLLRCAFGGRAATIKVGKAHWSYNIFATALYGLLQSPRADEGGAINLPLMSVLSRLDGLIERQYWTGLGGAGGGAELAGRPIPMVPGFVRNVPGILINAASNIWQFAEALSAMENPRDRGVPDFDGGLDYPDYATLAAATVPSGHWATCIALGLARYGSAVTLPTIDATGPEGWGATPGAIALWLAQTRLGAVRNFAAGRVDAGSFAQLDAARPWETGIYIDGEMTARQAIDRLMRDAGAAVLSTRSGQLSCVMYQATAMAAASISAADVDTAGIALQERVPAVKRVRISYAPRARVLGGGEMPDSVDPAERIDLAAVAQYVAATRSPADFDAREFAISTGLRHAEDAAALAEIAADLLSTYTHYYRIPLVGRPFLHWLADARALTYPRFGADAGLAGIVVGLNESTDGGNALILWGPRGTTP